MGTEANAAEAVDHRLGNAKESVAEKWGFEMTYVGERLFLFLYASTKSILLLRMNRPFQKRYLYKMKLNYQLNIEIFDESQNRYQNDKIYIIEDCKMGMKKIIEIEMEL